MKVIILIILIINTNLIIYGQSYVEYNEYKKEGDSAYKVKNYPLFIEYYEKLLQLPKNKRPEISATQYYNIACGYSLTFNRNKALYYLKKSFQTSNAKQNKNPHSASHLIMDTDLDLLRDSKGFSHIINEYYPSTIANFILSKEVSYNSLLNFVKYSNEIDQNVFREINIQGKTIYWEKDTGGKYIFNIKRLIMPTFKGIDGLIFKKCDFKLNFIWEGAEFLEYKPNINTSLSFENCNFHGRFLLDFLTLKQIPAFYKCQFKTDFKLSLNINPLNNYQGARFDSCSFSFTTIMINSDKPVAIVMTGNTSLDSLDINIVSNNVSTAVFSKNQFSNKNLRLNFSDVKNINFKENFFNNIVITKTNIESEFGLQSSIIKGKLLLSETYFSDATSHNIDWAIIDSLKLGLPISYTDEYAEEEIFVHNYDADSVTYTFETPKKEKTLFLTGEQDQAVSDRDNFQKLLGLHSMFLNLYKGKNDIESYNNCFTAIKELQSKRLKYLYKTNRTFESYFRWKLSQLLRNYVRYGTDPARAIVISFYIILIFGVFFFFFPSDWDSTSKIRLIENYKDFIQKNKSGYIKPFFRLLWGFFLSLLNALTLSLNAFITLGFGNIPTHGIARYFCVLEGFIGWFLLSIFTVAMINQVL